MTTFSSSSAKELRTFEGTEIKCHFYHRDEVMRVPATKCETDKIRYWRRAERHVSDTRVRSFESLSPVANLPIHRCAGINFSARWVKQINAFHVQVNESRRVTPVNPTAFIGAEYGIWACTRAGVSSHVNALTSANLRYVRVATRRSYSSMAVALRNVK